MGKRVLVTGLGTFWGARVAKALEADPGVDVIVGLDTREPLLERPFGIGPEIIRIVDHPPGQLGELLGRGRGGENEGE